MSGNTVTADGVIRRSETDGAREEAFIPVHVAESHASFLLHLSNGDTLCAWFAGTSEGKPDVSIYLSRLPAGGAAWEPEAKVSDDPERSEQNPVLFETPDGDVWLLYTAQVFGDQDTAIVRRRISKDGGRTWGAIEVLFDEPGTFLRQPMLVLSSGDWLLPIFHCPPSTGKKWNGSKDVSAVKVSHDQGATWSEHPVPDSEGAVHMSVVERRDGSLLALFRSRFADSIKSSTSTDGGRTWTAPVPTALPNNNSSIQSRRLNDDTLALVFNNLSASAEVQTAANGEAIWGAPRTPLSIALSYDEGATWPDVRDLEVAPTAPPALNLDKQDRRGRELSYPTVTADADGRINVAYTYFRKAIKFVRVSADWVKRT